VILVKLALGRREIAKYELQMTNDDARMTKETRNPNAEQKTQ